MTTTRPDLPSAQTELKPLALTIARTIQATPVHLGSPEGTADLTAALTVAVAAYMGRELGPAPRVLGEIVAERTRQDVRWGEQNHPDGTAITGDDERAASARHTCQSMAARGEVTWRDILWEEVAEALAESDPARLRAELIQVAAVAAAWVEAIDRRPPAEPAPAT
jgi:hypothetical protein